MLAASCSGDIMLTLYSYPELFGVADNNGYGLKVFAFLRLAGVPFREGWDERVVAERLHRDGFGPLP